MSVLPRATSDQDQKSYISTEKYCLDQCAEEILVNSENSTVHRPATIYTTPVPNSSIKNSSTIPCLKLNMVMLMMQEG